MTRPTKVLSWKESGVPRKKSENIYIKIACFRHTYAVIHEFEKPLLNAGIVVHDCIILLIRPEEYATYFPFICIPFNHTKWQTKIDAIIEN